MSRTALNPAEIESALATLPQWRHEDGALVRRYEFRDFNEAFGFMTRVALFAEREDHHPDWRNVWRTVDVRLSTHDAGAVTGRDLVLARRMDELAGDIRP